MIGVVHRNIPGATVEVFSLGPIWAGVVIRGVWFSIFSTPTGSVDVAIALCDGPVGDLSALQVGQSMVVSTDTPVAALGMPAMRTVGGSSVGREWVVPVYVPVRAGSVFVGVGVSAVPALNLTIGLVVEPERLVAPAVERGLASRRLGLGGDVMLSLAESARVARQ